MRHINANEKKMVAIMEKYGKVLMHKGYQGAECFSIEGYITPNGKIWVYIAYGNDMMDLDDDDDKWGMSDIEEAYIALEDAMLDMLERIQEENDALNKCQ